MPEQKMKITEEAFSDFTGHMCRAGFTLFAGGSLLPIRKHNSGFTISFGWENCST